MKRGRRTGVIAAASAVLIAAALIAPAAAAADPTSSTGSESAGASKAEPADPDGPQGPGRSPVAGLDDRAGRDNPDSIYRAGKTDRFQPLTDDSLSDTAAEKLGNADTRLLQQAQASKKKSVTVLMLARKGATDDVVTAVEKADGTVGSVTGKVGYVRATVPTDSVTTLAGLRSVAAIDLNRTYKIPGPDLGAAGARTAATKAAGPTAPGAKTPADNPYLPINETGAEAFVKNNPAWDGRGTVVGVLDTGVDVEHPALQTTSDGKPKIVDWVSETDPVADRDGSWVRMSATKTGPTFSYLGKTWTIPEGTFQFGVFYEGATAGSDFEGDLNRDGDTLDFYGVLYDPTTHRIWVDGNNNQDLTDETPMAPFAVDRQVGHLGSDDPATPQNERIPFVVEYRDNVDLSPLGGSNVGKTANYVSIGLPVASHGTHVAGITARHVDVRRPDARCRTGRADRVRPRLHLGRWLHPGGTDRGHDRPGHQSPCRRRQPVHRWASRVERRLRRDRRALRQADRQLRRPDHHRRRQRRPRHQHRQLAVRGGQGHLGRRVRQLRHLVGRLRVEGRHQAGHLRLLLPRPR